MPPVQVPTDLEQTEAGSRTEPDSGAPLVLPKCSHCFPAPQKQSPKLKALSFQHRNQLQGYTVTLGRQKLLRAKGGLQERIQQCLQDVDLGKFCGLTRQFSKHICCCCSELKRERNVLKMLKGRSAQKSQCRGKAVLVPKQEQRTGQRPGGRTETRRKHREDEVEETVANGQILAIL